MNDRVSKYSVDFSRKKHERWIKEGRGTGTGANYQGWIQYGDFPSKGNTVRHKEARHGRTVLALSTLEHMLLAVLECKPNVVAIYDQVPLDLETTQQIATRLNIPHPVADRSRHPFVMTSDFLVDVQTSAGVVQVPLQAKYVEDLKNPVEYRKLEIERLYWHARGLRLRIVTESPRCLPPTLVANAASLQQDRFPEDEDARGESSVCWEQRCAMVLRALRATKAPTTLNEMAHSLALHTSSEVRDFTSAIHHLIFKGEIPCDLHKPNLMQHDMLEIKQRLMPAANKGGEQ